MDRKSWGSRNRRRFFAAMSWSGDEGSFIQATVKERPLLNVCAGNAIFGDVRVDAYHPWPTVKADVNHLPFEDDSFAAVFMDPPWGLTAMRQLGEGFNEGIRVAPVLYIYSPIIWGTSRARLTHAWLRCLSGLNNPVILQRYERNGTHPEDGQDARRVPSDSPAKSPPAKSDIESPPVAPRDGSHDSHDVRK